MDYSFFINPVLLKNASSNPITRKAPAGNKNSEIGWSLRTGRENRVLLKRVRLPDPRISRIVAIMLIASKKPNPIPSASAIAMPMLFLEAKASALPKIMQLTTMRGRYMPRDS